MNITIKATNITTTPAITDYVTKKLSSLAKFVEADTICHVEVGKTTDHHKHGDIFKAEVRLYSHGKDVYAQVETSDLYGSIDRVREEIERQLINSKDKNISQVRKGGAKIKEMLKGFFGKQE